MAKKKGTPVPPNRPNQKGMASYKAQAKPKPIKKIPK